MSANLIGDGLYGVDVKQVGNRYCVIEVNDNPDMDAGSEDGMLKNALYREVMSVFPEADRSAQTEPYKISSTIAGTSIARPGMAVPRLSCYKVMRRYVRKVKRRSRSTEPCSGDNA
jgi:hypothetical protein